MEIFLRLRRRLRWVSFRTVCAGSIDDPFMLLLNVVDGRNQQQLALEPRSLYAESRQ